MKKFFYVAPSLHNAVNFINGNTDWKQINSVSFRNGDEQIVVISDFMRIRGRHVDGIYIDHTFTALENHEWVNFTERFKHLGIEPIKIEVRT